MKKKFIFPLISFLLFSGLNYFSDAEAKKHKTPPGHSKHHFKENDQRRGHGKHRHYRYETRNNYIVVQQPTRVIYRQPIHSFMPGAYYFYAQSPAYLSYVNAIAIGFSPRIFFSNGSWVLMIQ